MTSQTDGDPRLTPAEMDREAWQIINRHLAAAGLALVPELGSERLVSVVQPVLTRVFADETRTELLRALYAELHHFYGSVLDETSLWRTPETEMRLLVCVLTSNATPEAWKRYCSLFPPQSAHHTRLLDAINAEDERRRQDESGY
ncbi:MAG: hypothetical protein Q8L14_32955 [Myxococcales bacterium]|nr:hypothetical protein [Myxococcales bacterium]